MTQREELLQGGKRSSELTQEAHGQRARLLQSTESLQTSSTRLEQTQRIVMETEEIGTSILTDLAEQRETLEHTRDRVRALPPPRPARDAAAANTCANGSRALAAPPSSFPHAPCSESLRPWMLVRDASASRS